MRLIDNPLPQDIILATADSVRGNISRICVSTDPEEIISSLGFATDRLSMIAYSRIKELLNGEES